MARVYVMESTTPEDYRPNDQDNWVLLLQWCRYIYDDGSNDEGYRFIWRRPISEGGGLQAARGQARIPSLDELDRLVRIARDRGWGDNAGE